MNQYVNPNSSLTIDDRKDLFKRGGALAIKMSSIFRVIVKIGNYLFMHGGIHKGNIESLNDITIYNINLNTWLNENINLSLSRKIYDNQYSSITWYRGMIHEDESNYITFLDKLDTTHKLKVIVGHTITQPNAVVPQIITRASGRIILFDTAMSRAFVNNVKDRLCDLSNNQYNISFIIIVNDNIIYRNKQESIYKELEKELKSKISTESRLYVLKKYDNINKKRNYFSSHDYHLVIFTYNINKYGIATINIDDDKLHKVYKIEDTTKIRYIESTMEIEFKDIINVSNNESTSFTIIFKNHHDSTTCKTILISTQPIIRKGGRIRSKNNRKRNRITKYKKNRSKKYYRASKRK
jgi:hypothetical protein